jgi:hypothetical protein
MVSVKCHCEGVKRSKPCPEPSEGTHEIAAGFALATTASDCHDA